MKVKRAQKKSFFYLRGWNEEIQGCSEDLREGTRAVMGESQSLGQGDEERGMRMGDEAVCKKL
jgi:hypothetical protein